MNNIPFVQLSFEDNEESDEPVESTPKTITKPVARKPKIRQPQVLSAELQKYLEYENNLDSPEVYRDQKFPSNLCFSKRYQSDYTGFATQLWNILNYAGNDTDRRFNIGCGWISATDFFLIKNRFCIVTKINYNTLNFKLRQYKFQNIRKERMFCFWKLDTFTNYANSETLNAIDQRKSHDEVTMIKDHQLFLITALDDVHLFLLNKSEIPSIKSHVVELWQRINNKLSLFAIEKKSFITNLVTYLSVLEAQSNKHVNFDNQNEIYFSVYLSNHNLTFDQTVYQMISYVLQTEKDTIVTLLDFFNFYSRFGPDNDIVQKLHSLLLCSTNSSQWFIPQIQQFDHRKQFSGSYSRAMSNCFVIKRQDRKWAIHIYNMVNMPSDADYLYDENTMRHINWHALMDYLK